jgi:hypothetical protein
MEKISPGQIHLADQRGITQNNNFRRYSGFKYDGTLNLPREAFGPLQVFNDETLAAAKAVDIAVEQACYFVLIPITGAIIVKDAQGKNTMVDVGEVFVNYLVSDETLRLENPYHSNWINFLYLQVNAKGDVFPFFEELFSFDFSHTQNELISLIPVDRKLPFNLHIGQFGGRQEAIHHLKNRNSLLYAFVIAGAFEIQGRLMHERDGLALWQLQEADLEALSNSAVVMLLEMEGEES